MILAFILGCINPTPIATAQNLPPEFQKSGIGNAAYDTLRKAHYHAVKQGKTTSNTVTLIDLSLPSTQKRLWVLDLEHEQVLHHAQVTHGRNSDQNNDGYVDKDGLSNDIDSKKSSIGVYLTQDTYYSNKFEGTALRLEGLEPDFNDNARKRAIVMHPADYADRSVGTKLGRSWGCPALHPKVSEQIIDTIQNDQLLIQYYPDKTWLTKSEFLKEIPIE